MKFHKWPIARDEGSVGDGGRRREWMNPWWPAGRARARKRKRERREREGEREREKEKERWREDEKWETPRPLQILIPSKISRRCRSSLSGTAHSFVTTTTTHTHTP